MNLINICDIYVVLRFIDFWYFLRIIYGICDESGNLKVWCVGSVLTTLLVLCVRALAVDTTLLTRQTAFFDYNPWLYHVPLKGTEPLQPIYY